jgi:hypothetical protein
MIIVAPDLRETIAARFQRLRDEAPCRDCGATDAMCRTFRKDGPGPEGLCCWSGRHSHDMNPRHLAALHAEIASGAVRTVEEAHPAPVQGPRRVSMNWLLHQGELWQPQRGPAVRIADMHICHRYHTVRWLEARAPGLAFRETMWMAGMASGPFGPSGDMACDAFEREVDEITAKPLVWMRSTALHRSLSRALPRRPRKVRLLVARAAHWSTCPCRDDLTATCACPPRPPVTCGTGSDAEGVNGL